MGQKNYSSIFLPMAEDILERVKTTTERKLATELQREVILSHNIEIGVGTIRNWIHKIKGTGSESKEYSREYRRKKRDGVQVKAQKGTGAISAMDENGMVMDIDKYCETYGLPRADIKSYKLVTHTGVPFYNTQFYEKVLDDDDDFDYMGALKKAVKGLKKHKKIKFGKLPRTGVLTITDIHFGSYVLAMKNTPAFNMDVLADMFDNIALYINSYNYDKVHVHMLGDLIESFTGTNHKNVWKEIDRGMYGVNVVKAFVEMIHDRLLSKIKNLASIKMVAGNHDRVTSSKEEDMEGDAAKMVAWALKLMNYDVEFSPTILTHVVDGICYILNHGHLGLTKMSTKEMCYDFGQQGMFNFVMEGHLHSRFQNLTAIQRQKFKMVDDDTKHCRRQICPPLFTGNTYSEQGGWSTTAGLIISEAAMNGKPIVHDYPL